LRNLASALFLTERDAEDEPNAPKVRGRIVTTLPKAKEVRPLVERCITIARRVLPQQDEADRLEPDADRNSPEWREWRNSERWQEWNQAVAPVVAARRRAMKLLGDKQAVAILFDEIAPRFEDRPGGYTRVLRLATPRLGDAGTQAIIEFVGKNDRKQQKSIKPSFDTDDIEDDEIDDDLEDEATSDDDAGDEDSTEPTAEGDADVEDSAADAEDSTDDESTEERKPEGE